MKTKYLYILCLLIAFAYKCRAQNSIDSATIYFQQKNYDKAIEYSEKSLKYNENKFGINSLGYANSLDILALLYHNLEKYSKAESLYIKTLEIKRNLFGENNINYSRTLSNLATMYDEESKFSKSEPLHLRALQIKKEILGEKNSLYVISLNNLAVSYLNQGKYSLAEPTFLKILNIKKEISGEENLDYALSVSNLAVLYKDQGKYSEAEPLLIKSLKITSKISGEKSKDYAGKLNNLADLYYQEANYSLAESYFNKAILVINENFGQNNLDYAMYVTNLAVLYSTQGKYYQAEPLFIKTLEIKKEILGEKNLDYAESLNGLALLYEGQGKYSEAEQFLIKSLEIKKEILGEANQEYASQLINLSSIYVAEKKYAQAEQLLLSATEIIRSSLGERNILYANAIDALAIRYNFQGMYSQAENLFVKALEIRKDILGEKHPAYAISLNNLAEVYSKLHKYSQAESLLKAALEITIESLGSNHPRTISYTLNLADMFRDIDLNTKASIYFEQFTKANQIRITNDIYGLSEKEIINYVNVNKESLFSPLAFIKDFPNLYPNINIGSYDNLLLLNSLSLHNKQYIIKSIKIAGDKSLLNTYQLFLNKKALISKLQDLPISKRPSNLDSLYAESNQLEKTLSTESSVFSEYQKALSIKWTNVKNELKNDEVSICYLTSNYYKNQWTDSIYYGAFIVGKNFKAPKFFPLIEQKQLESLLNIKNTNATDSARINKLYKENTLSDLLVKPLEKELKGINTVYLTPAGLGFQIDFGALLLSNNQRLGDKVKLHILNSPAEIISKNNSILDSKSKLLVFLYGGIDYNKIILNEDDSKEKIENNSEIVDLQSRSGIINFDYLVGSNKEVHVIEVIGNTNGFNCKLFNESEATKSSIINLDGRNTPFILHLATHGFFFPDPKSRFLFADRNKPIPYRLYEDPMMRSGLIFAGANRYWKNQLGNNLNDNGILSAKEISELDLSACQLVVLSACETGLGHVNGSEGVFGLQRAFKMAGVKNIIMSLWKVPDLQTSELFDFFYHECFAGKSINEAFQLAQSKMKAKYAPYYWAGFILLE